MRAAISCAACLIWLWMDIVFPEAQDKELYQVELTISAWVKRRHGMSQLDIRFTPKTDLAAWFRDVR